MLDLYPSLMLVVLLIFFFLIYQLNQKLFKPLLQFMDQRDSTIAKDLKAAKSLSSDSDELLAKAEENLNRARSEAAQLRQEAIEKIKEENRISQEKRLNELEGEYAEFRKRLEEEREALKSVVLSQLPLIKEGLKAKFSQI
ncbi:F0F1 ATP synthase subunit B family protein [Nitratifractor sp.]